MSLANPDFSRNRFEIKYLAPVRDIEKIKDHLAGIIEPDEHHGDLNDGYYNHSIYFDDYKFSHYREKHEGLDSRVKIRLRAHREAPNGPASRYFIELKHRRGPIGKKDRYVLNEEQAAALLDGQVIPGIGPDLDKPDQAGVPSSFYYLVKKGSLRPIVSILYHRAAYHTPLYRDVRITFDTGVRASSITSLSTPLTSYRPCLDPRDCVVELKYFNSAPRLIMKRLNELGLRQVTLSKYAAGVESTFRQIAHLNHLGGQSPRSRPG